MSEQNVNGTVAVENSRGGNGFLVLLRHGQTVWSESGQAPARSFPRRIQSGLCVFQSAEAGVPNR